MLLGIDLGTTAVKVALFSRTGALQAKARRSYPTREPQPMWAEQEPERWWEATVRAIRDVMRLRTGSNRIEAIGLCGQTPGQVVVDAGGRPMGNAIIWRDRRAEREAQILRRKISSGDARRLFGQAFPVDSAGSASRLLWLARHRRKDVRTAAAIIQPKDFLGLRLTGVVASDPLSNFGLAHIGRARYDSALAPLLQIPSRLLPPLSAPEAVRGHVTGSAARLTGLRAGTPVSVGTIDAWCSVYGAGAVDDGMAVDIAGTSEVVGAISRYARRAPGLVAMPLWENLSFVGGPTQIGGAVVQWIGSILGLDESDVLRLARQAPPGADGLVLLPYLAGERAPVWDAGAQGVYFGLALRHGRAALARAALEGVGFAVRQILELCGMATGHGLDEVRVCGGAAVMPWTAFKADITGRSFVHMRVRETAALGAAMLAGVGCGHLDGLRHAARRMAHVATVIRPDRRHRRVYDTRYQTYVGLYPRLKDL